MADEMDESKGAEESSSVRKEKAAEGAKASSVGGDEDGAPSLRMASEQPGVGESSAVSESATAHDPTVQEAADLESVAVAAEGLEASVSTAAPAGSGAEETFFGAAQTVDQGGPQRPAAAFSGAASRPPAGGQGEGELDRPGLDLLYDVELDATLQFGSKEMLLRDVLELGPGDVVELDRHIAQPVDLVVGDRIVARGEVVVASGNFALRVTEVATPQMRLESIRCLF